jgi:hypothetical protein
VQLQVGVSESGQAFWDSPDTMPTVTEWIRRSVAPVGPSSSEVIQAQLPGF